MKENATAYELKNHVGQTPTIKTVFHHKYTGETPRSAPLIEIDPQCICRSCVVENKLLPNILGLFFIGFVFPPAYFVIWCFKIYATCSYLKETERRKEEYQLNIMEQTRNFATEGEELQQDDSGGITGDPFADQFAVMGEGSGSTSNIYSIHPETNADPSLSSSFPNQNANVIVQLNNDYDFEVHLKTNRRFNRWCGRSLIVFICQLTAMIILITRLNSYSSFNSPF